MMIKEQINRFPFRLGTTSYIIPDDILPNVLFLSDKVKDIEFVLFDIDNYCNIPSAEQIAELDTIAKSHNLTYTIHLPLDLKFSGNEMQTDVSIIKARKVIHDLEKLNPEAFILHLDSHSIEITPSAQEAADWVVNCAKSLNLLLEDVSDPKLLAVENLESYPPSLNHAVLARVPVSECIDIGHLWLQSADVPVYLESRIERTKVIHLHGIGTRDHQSLQNTPFPEVKRVIDKLVALNYRGVLTLEVFSQADFYSSMEVLDRIW
ncbi:MAG: cobamide remodeling phosphodiesterase CbiR [Flexilinea sp.]